MFLVKTKATAPEYQPPVATDLVEQRCTAGMMYTQGWHFVICQLARKKIFVFYYVAVKSTI